MRMRKSTHLATITYPFGLQTHCQVKENGYPRMYGEPLSAIELHVWHEGSNGGGKIQSNEGGF